MKLVLWKSPDFKYVKKQTLYSTLKQYYLTHPYEQNSQLHLHLLMASHETLNISLESQGKGL